MTQKPDSALRELCRGVWPVPDAARERQRRERIAGRVLELQRQLSAGSVRRRRIGLGLALAALVGGASALFVFVQPGARPTASQQPIELVDSVRLVSGHASLRHGASLAPLAYGQLDVSEDLVLVTRPEDSAEFRLSSDTAVDLGPASEVGIARRRQSLGGLEERVRLSAGSVALRVPKLGTHGKVSVETRDALVEVHGTQFSVRVVERPPLDSFTEVDVREGRVLVRAGETSRFLAAGDHWSSLDREPAAQPVTAVTPAPAAVVPERILPARAAPPPQHKAPAASVPRAAVPVSELAAQNRLLEAAELAQKSGMPGLALQRLETLMQRYPDAELAHNARVARFRLLNGMGRKIAAEAAAKDYLERYPHGFARDEAERLSEAAEAPAP